MNESLKVGIVGYGVVGKRRRYFIDLNSNLEVKAICDININSFEKEEGVDFYSDYNDLFSSKKLDILFVCLPNHIATKVTILGLKNNIHVFCEKPPGKNLEDISRVISAENNTPHLKLMYGFNHRYHESIKEALRIVRSGELGKVINLRGVYGKSKMADYEDQSAWRTKRSLAGGGILLDQGIHMVDLFRLFAGEFEDIHSFIDNGFWDYDVEDNAYALMKTKSGVVAFLNSTATEWRHKFHLDIALEKGSINLSGILSGSKSYGEETLSIAYRNKGEIKHPKEVRKKYSEDNSWQDEINVFVDSILFNKKLESGTSYEAYRTMELVYRIYCADKNWQEKFNLSDSISKGRVKSYETSI